MPRRRWTHEQTAEAVRLYGEVGAAEAARRTGMPLGTVKSLAQRAGVATGCIPSLQVATTVAALTLKDRRLRLADDLHDQLLRLLDQLWEPTTVYHWGTESDHDERGRLTGTRTVFLEHTLARPTFADQKTIMGAVAIALDRSLKLTGDDTPAIEANVLVLVQQVLRDLPPEMRAVVADRLDRIETPTMPAA